MKLNYIDNLNEYGDNVVRLFDFDKLQSIKFRDLVEEFVVGKKQELDLATIDFIEAINCNLILRIAEEDEGILSEDNVNFYCDLTLEGYNQMLILLQPFCEKETKGFKYLYDIDSLTDLLFAPAGS
jgi:hypothetical protein